MFDDRRRLKLHSKWCNPKPKVQQSLNCWLVMVSMKEVFSSKQFDGIHRVFLGNREEGDV